MRNPLLKTILATVVIGFIPLTSFADANAAFKTSCVQGWMERAGDSSDKVAFQNFGEKFCDCASTKTITTDAEMGKAAQVCMSQTLLHSTMDTLEDKEGLRNATDTKISDSCMGVWNIIYPKMDDAAKAKATAYCQCAAPKLSAVAQEDVTDQQYTQKVSGVADDCAGNVTPDKAATEAKTK